MQTNNFTLDLDEIKDPGSSSGISVGLIVGCAVGGVALIIVVLVILVFCINRRKTKGNVSCVRTIKFSLNVFSEFSVSDKNICHYSKRAQTCHPGTSCVRDQDATTASARNT